MQGSDVKVCIRRLGCERFLIKMDPASFPISNISISTEVTLGSVKSEKGYLSKVMTAISFGTLTSWFLNSCIRPKAMTLFAHNTDLGLVSILSIFFAAFMPETMVEDVERTLFSLKERLFLFASLSAPSNLWADIISSAFPPTKAIG